MNETCLQHICIMSPLTLLCADASLHKTSRQANKFVYLHIFSPKFLDVKFRDPKRRSLHSVRKIKRAYFNSIFMSHIEDLTVACTSACMNVRVCAARVLCAPCLHRALSAHQLSSAPLRRWEESTHRHAGRQCVLSLRANRSGLG